jgi:5-hydroxyisourate hydrolase
MAEAGDGFSNFPEYTVSACRFAPGPRLGQCWKQQEDCEMSGYLTTHVLDTARGCPAGGLRIELYRLSGGSREKRAQAATNDDGRTDAPILPAEGFATGSYELVFHAGSYLRATGQTAAEPLFLDQIPIRFGISEAASHYHVPLLLSPFGYSTYRGS